MMRIAGRKGWGKSGLAGLLLLILPVASAAASPSLEGEAGFSTTDVVWDTWQGYDHVRIRGFVLEGPPGYPELPEKGYYYVLPAGYRVKELRVTQVEREVQSQRRHLMPVLSSDWEEKGITEAAAVYQSASEYPGRVVELAGVGAWRGERIAQVLYHPVGYSAVTGEVVFYPRVEFALVLTPGEEERPPVTRLRCSPNALKNAQRRLAAHVANAPLLADGDDAGAGTAAYTPFRPTEYPSLDGSLVEYVIIAADEYAVQFQDLANWKIETGTTAAVRTISWVIANYPGLDVAEKIRNFITDAYRKWGTEYVLLGGDTDKVPTRYAHTSYYYLPNGENIPTDFYYSALDGSWDGDGDGIFGEGTTVGDPGDSVDFYPEIAVGRAPVNTTQEAEVFVAKTIAYRRNPIPLNQNTVCFFAEVLFPYGWSPGMPIWLNGCDIAQDAIAWMTAAWDTALICEWPDQNMNFNSVRAAMNAGYGLASGITHGDAFKISTSDNKYLRIDDILGLTNTNKYSVYYYSNCNTSQFDAECLNEAALFNQYGGGVASIAPSRLEFPHVSRDYLVEFYRLVFRTGLDVFGELDETHRLPFIGDTVADGASRWIYLAQVLLGDPGLRVWKSLPDSVTLVHSGSMSLADSVYTVTVTDASGGGPVAGAQVVLWNSSTGDYARGLTDATGQVVCAFYPTATGPVNLAAEHPAYKTKVATFTVTGAAGRMRVNGVVIDDDAVGYSSGNGDGIADAGERVELGVQLKNVGTGTVTGVDASLGISSGSSLTLDVLQGGVPQPARVFIGEAGVHPGSLPITIGLGGDTLSVWGRPMFSAGAPEDSGAYFWVDTAGWHLRLVGGLGPHTFSGSLATDGAVLTAVPWELEGGDILTPTTTQVTFSVTVDSSDCEDGMDLVVADSSNVSILIGSASYGNMAPGDTATQYFLLETATATPDRHEVRLNLPVTGTTLGSGLWQESIRLEVEAPFPSEEYHAVDDTTYWGDGDGIIDVGETVILYPQVRNNGHGAAIGVQGKLRVVSGIIIGDSTDTFGDIAAGALASGGNGFRLSSTSGSMMARLELLDGYGRSWTEDIELGVPSRPVGVYSHNTIPLVSVAVDLFWNDSPEADLWGYNVYRSATSGSGYARMNSALVVRSAFYHDTAVNPCAQYFYRVAAVDSAGNESARSLEVAITSRPAFQGSWPRTTKGTIWSSPLMMDLGEDSQGDLEVLVGSEDGWLYCFNADGTTRVGWPKSLGAEIWSSPAVGNLDGDSAMEIVVGCNNKKIYAFNHDGTGLTSPDGTFYAATNEIRSTPTLADLDRDGDLEIIVGSYSGNLLALHHNGTGYMGSATFASLGYAIAASPTVADLDNNGDLEVLCPTLNGKVFAFNHDKTHFLADTTGLFYNVGQGIWASLAVGDVDLNGFTDVIGASWNGKVYRWNRTGFLQPGWPKTTGGEIWASPALGNITGDANLEIVVGSSDRKAYALSPTGTDMPGWPVTLSDSSWSSPCLVDITGDGSPEVIMATQDGHIHALKGNGTAVPGWPQVTTDRCYSSGPCAADLDRDGDVEVMVGAYDGRIYCWDVLSPWNPSPSASPWPTFCHDSYRTGWYNQPFTDVASGETPTTPRPAFALAQNSPNPFNPRTAIHFQLPAEGPATLGVYDVSGRRVKTLVSGPQAAGSHEVVWEGKDEGGHEVASGVYFYRLEAGEKTMSRKMILLR